MKQSSFFKTLILALSMSIVLFSTYSCGSSEAETPVVLSISLDNPAVSSDKGSQTIHVSASGPWIITVQSNDESSTDWVRVSPKEGKGSAEDVVLTWQQNDTPSDRSCELIIKNSKTSSRCSFTQSKHIVTLSSDPVANWLELPAVKDNDGLTYVTHSFEADGKTFRNYSLYLNPNAKVAQWIAYPLNNGIKGTGSRNDSWGTEAEPNLDPKVPREYQAVLHHAFKPSGYDRGHQVPSADRYRGNSNAMTYYGTNMSPQMSSFNQGIWATLEGKVRNWASSMDTLYVVTGCNLDGVTKYATDNDGKDIAIPTGYFKALLGYKKSATIGETKNNDGYTSIAFYFDHKAYSNTNAAIMEQSLTVKELEEKLGIDFFVNLPAIIGKDKADNVENLKDTWFNNN